MKKWRSKDEWMQYAACGDSPDHTLPPTRPAEESHLPVADPEKVRKVCDGCPVRPECSRWATGPDAPVDVWTVGVFIPVDKRQAKKVRAELVLRQDEEDKLRGEI